MTDLAPDPVRMTGAEFDRLGAAGDASVRGRTELRQGVVTRMAPEYLPHGRLKFWLGKKLEATLTAAGLSFVVDLDVTVRFSGRRFRPLPDLTVWNGGPLKGPIPGDRVRLIVEIADETLSDNLGPKRIEYAAAGLPEYWVLDVNARALHIFHDLVEGDYRGRRIVRAGEKAECVTLAGVTLDFDPPALG